MATYDEIMKALRNADAAGDTAAATRLAAMAREAKAAPAATAQRPQSQVLMDEYKAAEATGDYARADDLLRQASFAATQDGTAPEGVTFNPATGRMEDLTSPISPYIREGRGRAAMQGAGQGLGFGGMDEVVSGLYGMTGPGSFGENAAFADAVMDEELKRGRDQHPVISGGSEIAGGLATGLAATGGIGAAKSLMGRLGQAIGIGGGSGAVYGGLSTEGDMADRGMGALIGGGIGAGFGAASVPVEAGIRAIGTPIVNGLRNLSPSVKPDRVEAALAAALSSSGQSGDDVARALQQAADDGQGVFTLADALGDAGQRKLSGVARGGGPARQVVTDALNGRQAAQGERVSAALVDALDASDTAAARRAAMTEARNAQANTAYSAARSNAGPVEVRGALAAIDDRIGPMQGSGVRGDGIDAKLAGYRSRLAAQPGGDAFPGASSVELSDFSRVLGVKQSIQDDIGQAVRAGRNNEARELQRVVAELDRALEASSPDYRAANDAFARSSREIDQIDAGANAARPGARAADNIDAYRAMPAGQQDAYRAGYADRILGRVENSAEGVNKARQFTSGKSVEELAAMARDPNKLARVLDRENVMFETRRQAIGGSQTADNLADMGAVDSVVRNGVSPIAWARDIAGMVGNAAKGQNEATRTALAEALMSTGGEAAENIAKAVARGDALSADQELALQTIIYLQGGGAAQAAK